MLNEGLVALAFDCRQHLIQLTRLANRYADRKPDLADLCVVRMSELLPKHSVITIDRTDFRVYLRNKREAIPILSSPNPSEMGYVIYTHRIGHKSSRPGRRTR